ncbi:hypothetical protein NPIL_580211 [Nephila pilipes]|uniref:Uncharacterized protein n=1 Tax=Nephila pilipes TaxID=299642 RepID=A0A8X6N2R7_NEPPI|nr:hypothetical protein NPIL_580211 [Nephila pilipes]
MRSEKKMMQHPGRQIREYALRTKTETSDPEISPTDHYYPEITLSAPGPALDMETSTTMDTNAPSGGSGRKLIPLPIQKEIGSAIIESSGTFESGSIAGGIASETAMLLLEEQNCRIGAVE